MANGSTLADCNVRTDDTIHLVLKNAEAASSASSVGDKNRKTFQLFVKTLTGTSYPLDVASTDPIEFVKAMLEEKAGHAPEQMRLVFAGREMANGTTLGDYSIRKESTLHLVIPVASGA